MKATKSKAENNERNLTIKFLGRGGYEISCTYRGKTISTYTTNTTAIDDFNSDPEEVGTLMNERANRRLSGYKELCEEIIKNNE